MKFFFDPIVLHISRGYPNFKCRSGYFINLNSKGGMRIGEVLKLAMNDIHDQKLTLRDPKSGREYEYVFIPVKVAHRLREYAKSVCENPNERIFPISYEAARIMVIKAGQTVGIHLRPHDLRRHSATFASRCFNFIALQCPKMMIALEKSMMISLIQSESENQYVCNNLI